MIIDDEDISRFFVNYFDYLWRESTKIEKITILEKYMEKFDYNEQEKVKLREIIDQIKKEGIIDDI